MIQIAIFASGAGSNAREIIRYFSGHPQVRVAMVACNKPGAGVIQIALNADIPVLLIEKDRFFRGDGYLDELANAGVDAIVLAGFLWKIPASLIKAFPGRIINIHPALLPAYGGKGMYGSHVHEAVIHNREKESGITIHEVDEHYDHGQPIFQARVIVDETDTAASLAEKIHRLEHQYYPGVIESWLKAPRKG